jgi:hypothetical protein
MILEMFDHKTNTQNILWSPTENERRESRDDDMIMMKIATTRCVQAGMKGKRRQNRDRLRSMEIRIVIDWTHLDKII